ncbi:MAG: YbaB/EbfC family nucleoid-associated protein [Candidatus Magasanikbacteria bacterium]
MFDKLKQMKKLKDLQSQMKSKEASFERDGVEVTVNGSMKIEDVSLNNELSSEKQERLVKKCANKAFDQLKKEMAKDFS